LPYRSKKTSIRSPERLALLTIGNVGSNLLKKLRALGIGALVCDPPKAEQGDKTIGYVDLETIISECNLISLHVPLTHSGVHTTYHLFNWHNLARLKHHCLPVDR